MKLQLLNCPICHRPLTPQDEDVVVGCSNCRSPIALGEAQFAQATVTYAQAALRQQPDRWLPFWLYQGRVSIRQRDTQGGRRRIGDEAVTFWASPRYFYVPAWEISMTTVRQIGAELIQQQPRFQGMRENPYPTLPFVSANVTAEDAKKLIEFIVLDIEVRRKDWLKRIDFSVGLSEPSLWAIPAIGQRLVATV